jgi:hypothetical protein
MSPEQDRGDFGCTGCGYQIVLRGPDISCPMCGTESWVPIARRGQLAEAEPGNEVLGELP